MHTVTLLGGVEKHQVSLTTTYLTFTLTLSVVHGSHALCGACSQALCCARLSCSLRLHLPDAFILK
jgi:hypothetical protein